MIVAWIVAGTLPWWGQICAGLSTAPPPVPMLCHGSHHDCVTLHAQLLRDGILLIFHLGTQPALECRYLDSLGHEIVGGVRAVHLPPLLPHICKQHCKACSEAGPQAVANRSILEPSSGRRPAGSVTET
eukprot:COSAG01_NODE_1511_length_10068_cov_7.643731_3_plen_129_part_00